MMGAKSLLGCGQTPLRPWAWPREVERQYFRHLESSKATRLLKGVTKNKFARGAKMARYQRAPGFAPRSTHGAWAIAWGPTWWGPSSHGLALPNPPFGPILVVKALVQTRGTFGGQLLSHPKEGTSQQAPRPCHRA